MSFDFYKSFCFQLRASRYITGLNQTSVYKVIVNSICTELRIRILSVSIYYGTQLDTRVKSHCRLNLIRASIFNLEHLDIFRDTVGHPSKKLLSFAFATSFRFQFEASRYITGLNRTFECLDILRESIGHPSKNILAFEFATSFFFQFEASRYITALCGTSE